MLRKIKEIYHNTLNEKDNFWTRKVSRPFAAMIVYFIKDTPLEPNHITIISYFIAAISGFIFVFWHTYSGLIIAALIFQFSFVMDCVDGQLARIRCHQSKLGHKLDTLFDAMKALLIVAAISLRLFFIHQNSLYLLMGIIGLVLVSTSLMITRLTRTEEYLKSIERIKNNRFRDNGEYYGKKMSNPFVFSIQAIIKILEKIGKFLIHYPSYIIYFSLLNKIEWFFFIYVGTYLLYTFKIFLSTVLAISKT